MAIKRIIKFLLQMAVAAGLVVGAYFGIKAIIDAKNGNNYIAQASQSQQVEAKVTYARDARVNISGTDKSLYEITTSYVLRYKITGLNRMNQVLLDYYNHYISLTGFENASNGGKRNQILSKIDELIKQADKTKYYLDLIKTANSNELRENRVKFTTEEYVKQTEILIQLDELLKDYVFEVNYKTDNSGIVFEAQLEMIKDYSKAVFYKEVKNHLNEASSLLVNTNSSDWAKVVDKFIYRQKVNINSDTEAHFAWQYMKIDKEKLNEFYVLNHADKANYYNEFNINNSNWKYFQNLYAYLTANSY